MDLLKEKFQQKSAELKQEIRSLLKAKGNTKVDELTLGQVYGGMRGLKSMVWETSALDPYNGIRFRGYSIPELKELLPKHKDGKEPMPEGLFWLMLVDEIPTQEQAEWLSNQWLTRSNVPEHVFKVIDAMPKDSHPMAQFSAAVVAMKTDSVFDKRYTEGMNKSEYWDATYEDSMNLIARLPRVASYIYRRAYHKGKRLPIDPDLDWSGNFATMLGKNDDDFKSFMRLYLTIHADHEGGNASAHASHLVGSTLSDAYMSFASGLNALAGPLHGRATQEVISWVFNMIDALGTTKPTREQITKYVQSTLDSGRVIPGYGHAVLREPDPRFIAQKNFAKEYIKGSDLIETIWEIFEIVPPMLKALGKVKNPWPNVDAHSGAILVNYGMKEFEFYTVMFGVSRSLGVLAALCWSRALGFPLERPKSVTTKWVINFLKEKEAK